MTAATFERLLYTDCRPGAGLGAGGGFQVQAQSPGVDDAQSALAVRWLLYEVQNAWIVQRRPVADFPLGFAHASSAGYGTAQGVYLGKEVTGGRQGNHLSDCLLTRDPELYGTLRPAQLWRSPLWRAVPWDTTACPPYAGGADPGPLTLDVVTDWFRARPERRPALASLLSVLEAPDGERVVILTEDPDEAVTWIAAATLLLPARRALDVSFKVFSAAPLRAEHRVVAAPPGLNPQVAPGILGGVFVLDAAACACDARPASERADFLTGKLAGDDDPYDIVDAIELAEELADGTGQGGIADLDALRTAWSITVPGDPPAAPDSLFRWLRDAGPAPRREHGPAVAAMLLGSAIGAGELRWLDAAGDLGLDFPAVRVRLFDAELADACAGQPPPAQVLPPTGLDSQSQRDVESRLASALLLSSDGVLDAGQVDRVLRLARRHGITPELSPPLQRQLEKFAVVWVDQPTQREPHGWALREEILDLVHQELRDRLGKNGPAATMDAIRVAWPYFAERADDPGDPLYCQLQAAAIAAAPGDQRIARLRAVLARVAALRGAGQPAAAQTAATRLQQALLDWQAVDATIAITILTALPGPELNPGIARFVNGYIAQAAERPDAALLDLLQTLHKLGWQPQEGRAARLLDAELKVREFQARATSAAIDRHPDMVATARLIGGIEPRVLTLRAEQIVDSLFRTANPALPGEVFASIPAKGQEIRKHKPATVLFDRIYQRLCSCSAPEDQVIVTHWCLDILVRLGAEEGQRQRYENLSKMLHRYAVFLGRDAGRWRDGVTKRVSMNPRVRAEWERFLAQTPSLQGVIQGIIRGQHP